MPGHWEEDLILGLGSSAIGTLVERTTRFTMLLRMPGQGETPAVKNGLALAGHGAGAVREAITRTIVTLPEQLRRSLTWDQGAEMAEHAKLKVDAGVQVYFCDPQSPWQRATNENTDGLLRQCFPKGTDLCAHKAEQIAAVGDALNTRPRKALNWKTPAERRPRQPSSDRQSEAYVFSPRQRKKVEMLVAHLKGILRLDCLRRCGPSGANDELQRRRVCLIDQRRNLDRDDLADGLQLLGFGSLVEFVATNIGRASQYRKPSRCPSVHHAV